MRLLSPALMVLVASSAYADFSALEDPVNRPILAQIEALYPVPDFASKFRCGPAVRVREFKKNCQFECVLLGCIDLCQPSETFFVRQVGECAASSAVVFDDLGRVSPWERENFELTRAQLLKQEIEGIAEFIGRAGTLRLRALTQVDYLPHEGEALPGAWRLDAVYHFTNGMGDLPVSWSFSPGRGAESEVLMLKINDKKMWRVWNVEARR